MISDFGMRISDLRNAVYFKLMERSDSTNPQSAFRNPHSEIRNLKSQIMTRDVIGIKTG